MKILFILTQDIESPYGVGRFQPLARELTLLGNQVKAVALHPDYKNVHLRRFFQGGIYIHYVGQMHVKKQGSKKEYYSTPKLLWIALWATIRLTWAALIADTDVIHLGKPHPMNSLAGFAAKVLRGRVLFVDYDDFEIGINKFQGEWQRKIVGFFENWALHQANHITTNTKFLLSKIIDEGICEKNITYIPNGVDQKRFQPPDVDKVLSIKEALNLGDNYVIAYVGSLSIISHPIDLLFDAFVTVKQKIPDSTLLIVGGGESLAYLQQLSKDLGISESTKFTGRIHPDKVVMYYYLADVTIDPVFDNDTARGRSPLKLFESWICNTPFITGDVGDRQELLGSPPAGKIVKPGEANSIANAIIDLLNNPQKSKRIIQRGLIRANHFMWNKHASKLDQIYKQYNK
jgi:glycosyltransferase involved in cell wall biosynthesis